MSTIRHKIAVFLAAVDFAALAGILFWPSPVDKPVGGELTQFIKWLHNLGVPRWTVGYMQIEFTANILLFVPFGIIVTLRLHRKRWWLAVPVAAAISGAVELAQTLFLPQRFPAWSDIVANTSGAFIGALLVLFVWSRRRRRELRSARQRSRVT
ncbi:VanZ family protein [Arthrobacter sp. PAMC 25486]|uniref:VanZ family protein n=1 Tax=Arthrobacter sp. PAMC 25486 TaxID=1494608 RepID=UPI00056DEF4D|nr:VanZ family protein [Arthrobacter sp. PAMC 25486]